MSDTKAYEPQIRARLGTTAHFCEVVVLKLRAVPNCRRMPASLTLLHPSGTYLPTTSTEFPRFQGDLDLEDAAFELGERDLVLAQALHLPGQSHLLEPFDPGAICPATSPHGTSPARHHFINCCRSVLPGQVQCPARNGFMIDLIDLLAANLVLAQALHLPGHTTSVPLYSCSAASHSHTDCRARHHFGIPI